jgi:hypothetical protein
MSYPPTNTVGAVSQVWAAGALHPVAYRLTVNLRRAALAARFVVLVCWFTPFSGGQGVDGGPHTRPSVENENGMTDADHAVGCCGKMRHSQHVPLTRSCWPGRRECW